MFIRVTPKIVRWLEAHRALAAYKNNQRKQRKKEEEIKRKGGKGARFSESE